MKHSPPKILHSINGDWSSAGIERQIDYIKRLDHTAAPAGSIVRIDCSKIEDIDYNGFQVLYVWLQLLKNSGLRCSLSNIPDVVHNVQEKLGLNNLFKHH
jgi:anti-anti-sigma regulatory factor